MTTTQVLDRPDASAPATTTVDTKLEVLLLPVSDVHRAADFYQQLGWRLDVDHRDGDARIVHFTPPGSAASVMFGTGVSPSAPGSAQLTFLAVSDIVEARAALAARGIDVSEVFHDRNGGYRFDPPPARPASTRSAAATPRSPPSATRTATAGCCRK